VSAPWQEPPPPPGTGIAVPRVSPTVKMLLIANVAVFLVDFLLRGTALGQGLTTWLPLVPTVWLDTFPFVPVWQLLTYGFMHADAWHLISNMLFLYFLGTMLENEIGARRFLGFYLVAIVLAGVCQLFLGMWLGHVGLILGASGGVLAIVCAVATLHPTTRIIFILFPITLKTLALLYVGMDVLRVVAEIKGAGTGVASFAHLSGALFGFLAVRRRWIWNDPVAAVEEWRGRRDEERRQEDEEHLDDLLAKINREGIHSLSESERSFLKRVSRRR
jgi:membrane associated rhomboid family serine protease